MRMPDEVQLDAVRRGDFGACDELFRRHAPAARRAAARWVRDSAEGEDLVAEAFVRVLIAVRSGSGPRRELRPYLLTTMRNLAVNWQRRQAMVDLPGEVPDRPVAGTAADELTLRRWQAGLAWRAFCQLPGRWRTVLWHTEVEGTPAVELAPLLGVSPNGVAVLAVRAREGLRRAYLQAQVPRSSKPECDEVRANMGSWVRDGLSVRRGGRVAAHVDRCTGCRAVAAGLAEANQELRPGLARRRSSAVVVPLSAGVTGGGKVAAVVAAAVVAVAGAPIPPSLPVPPPSSAPPPVLAEPLPGLGPRLVPDPRLTPNPRTAPEPRPTAGGATSQAVPPPQPAAAPPADEVDLHPGERSGRSESACHGRGCGNAKAGKAKSGGNKWGGKPAPPGLSKSDSKSSTTPPGQLKKRGGG